VTWKNPITQVEVDELGTAWQRVVVQLPRRCWLQGLWSGEDLEYQGSRQAEDRQVPGLMQRWPASWDGVGRSRKWRDGSVCWVLVEDQWWVAKREGLQVLERLGKTEGLEAWWEENQSSRPLAERVVPATLRARGFGAWRARGSDAED
jgi:hypothetical protein